MKPRGRTPGWVGPFVLLDGVISGAVGGVFAYKWLVEDEPDVYGPCSRGSGTCLQGGETLNIVFGLVFGGLGLLGIAAGVWLLARHRARAAADRGLIERGRTGEAVVTSATRSGMSVRTNGRVTRQGYTLTLDAGDGGAPLVVKASLPPGIQPGTRVVVAYDPATRDAVLLDTPPQPPTGDLFASG